MFDQMHMLRGLLNHADRLIVPLMADIDDFEALPNETQHFAMHLAHQRAGGVDHMHAAGRGLGLDRRGHTVRGKNNRNARRSGLIRNFAELLHEHRTLSRQLLDHMFVMHDLTTHVHRWQAILADGDRSLQNRLYGKDRPIHTGAESARVRQYDAFGHGSPPFMSYKPSPNTRARPFA